MKRVHHEVGGTSEEESSYSMDAKSKMSMMMGDELQDAGDDEQLAALGYKVRSSSMADVAQKLEQLEMAMTMGVGEFGGGSAMDDSSSLISHLASETVHYNPSDLSSWVENMLSELNVPPLPPPPPPTQPQQQSLLVEDPLVGPSFDDDLSAIIPGGRATVYGTGSSSEPAAANPEKETIKEETTRDKKRLKPTDPNSTAPPPQPPEPAPTTTLAADPSPGLVPVALSESQETGIRLVHTLLACAEEVQQENFTVAEALVKQVSLLSMSQGGAMRKVATYFAQALARRIYRVNPPLPDAITGDAAFSDILEMHFYEACPYLKFAHFTANQAILEAFAGKSRVHVVDFGMKQGMQWPALMQALALRPGGPPSFRLTGIGPPQPDNTDALQQVGWKLAQLAETIHVEFEYRGFVANSLADLEPYMLGLGRSSEAEEEAVAVNSVFELHRLLGRQGAVEKVLSTVKAVRPSIVTVVEQEASHNGPVFLDRFTEALHYYCSMFDSLEGCATSGGSGGGGAGMMGIPPPDGQDKAMSEVYLGRQICNVVACEGPDRTERHETAAQWKERITGAGFEAVPLGSNAFKQASMLLELFAGGDGYRVEEKDGCLMLGWHTRPLITTSAWRIPSSSSLSSVVTHVAPGGSSSSSNNSRRRP